MKRGEIKRKTPLRAKTAMKRSYMRPKPKRGRKALIAEADRLLQEAVLAEACAEYLERL